MPEVKVKSASPVMDQERALNRYVVEVDGDRVGIVGQHRISAIRTRWFWEADEPLGGMEGEFISRQAAIDDLVGYVVSLAEGTIE